jgi:hypothetical protein
MTFEEAVEYVIREAKPYGLVLECLKEFIDQVEHENEHGVTPDYTLCAEEALWEWDI